VRGFMRHGLCFFFGTVAAMINRVLSGRIAGVLLLIALFAAQAQEGERAPFVTTPDEVVTQMLRFAGTGPRDLVVDLGSGDGRIPIAAAREFGARAVGIELDAALVAASRQKARAAEVEDRVSFVKGDVLLADFSQASVVTVYLLPSLIDRLQPRLLDELTPGTRIVSHAFAMTGWTADRSLTVRLDRRHEGQGDESTLHLWLVPAKVRGVWRERVAPGARPAWRFRVAQNFQQIEVEVEVAGGREAHGSCARPPGRPGHFLGVLKRAVQWPGRRQPHDRPGHAWRDRH
jgi:SAM-dependent methyltransferase